VDFAEARTIFLSPPTEPRGPSGVTDSPSRRLRDAVEPIATISFWGTEVHDRLGSLGLDFLTGYVWARAAPMGEPTAPVVVAAFGVFEPSLITGLYEQARAIASRKDVLAAREEGSVAALDRLLHGADVTGAVALLRHATDRIVHDVAGRPLFAGLVSLEWPADPFGQLWHAASLLREFRGDVHQAANVAAGLSGVQMNLLTEYWVGWEPTAYAGTRAWAPEVMAAADADLVARGLVAGGRLTVEGRRVRDLIEEQTDAAMQPVVDALGPDLDDLVRQLDDWSAQIIAGGEAPPDPYKRISG